MVWNAGIYENASIRCCAPSMGQMKLDSMSKIPSLILNLLLAFLRARPTNNSVAEDVLITHYATTFEY